MKTFYLISYQSRSGNIKTSVVAKDEQQAHIALQRKGLDTTDDNYIVEAQEYHTLRNQFTRL